MLEWIITSCVLIGIVLLVRLCLKNRISLRLRYALWLIVLVRLLVPVNFFNSTISVMNVVPEPAPVAELQQPEILDAPEQTPTQSITDTPVSQVPILPVNPTPITPVTPEVQEPVQLPQPQITEKEPVPEKTFSVTLLLQILWITGMAVTALVFFITNIRFTLRLKRTKQPEQADCSLPVYRSSAVDTPCLFGLFKPAIYLTQEAVEDEGKHHILTHEMTHYKHLDHIWGMLRCLCLVLHWYNPLVWVAAICSRRDSELACDEAVIKQLGEENRAEYGKTLIRMTCTKQNAAGIFTTATTMTGSKKTIKNRIKLIAKHPKTAIYAVICLILVAAIAVGCTFTGKKQAENTEKTQPELETIVITDKPASEVLTKSYKLEELYTFLNVEIFFELSPMTKNPEPPVRLADVHDKLPIECFKEEYIVYSVEEGGYFYIFPDISEPYKVGEQVDFSNTNVADTLYISGVCNLSDFDSIKYGKSTNQDVIDIDPNTITVVDPISGEIESRSALSDGRVLVISYEEQDDTRSAIVTDTQITSIKNEHFLEWYARIQYEDWPVDSAAQTVTENPKIEATDGNLSRTYPYGRLIYVNNSLYSLMISTYPVSFYNDPVKIGSIENYDSNSIPSIEFSSNYFPKGADIYQENLESDSYIYVKIRQQNDDTDDCWLRLGKTNMVKLRSTPMLTMNALKDIVERQSPEELKQFQGTVYAFGQGHGCEVQDAECYAFMYRDQFKLYRLSDLKELDLVTEKEKLDDFLKSEQISGGKLTISGLLLQKGFDIYADYLEYSVAFTGSEQSYDFSTHNHLFVADINFLLNGFDFSSTAREFDKDLSGISIYIHDMNIDACTITINKADQVKIHVGDSDYYYEAAGIYKFASNNLLEHTKKADKYYKVDNLGAPTTYSVYGFDTSEEKNRTPYYVSLTDDNFVYVWCQFGTGTMFRKAVFYDPAHNRVSPYYLGPSDYYGNMVVSYGRSDDETFNTSSVQVCDIFTGEILFTVDEFKVPINRSMVNAVWKVYFNRDGSAILVNYYDENYDLQWETVPLPTEIRLNRKVGPSSQKIPQYSTGMLKEKPWEDEEPSFEGVPDDQAGREIAQAVLDEKFPGYTFVSCTSWTEVEGWCSSFRFENEDGTKWVEIDIDMQTGQIFGIYPLEAADAIIDMFPENLLTGPVIADAETAGRIAEAIRAGWVRQTNRYIPYLSVQYVYYDQISEYWVVTLFPAVNYPADGMEYYIVLDSKDGHIVNMWAM